MVSLELCVQCSRVCVHQGWMHTSQKTIASPPLEIWKKHMQWSVVCSVIKFLDSNIFNCCTQWILISKHFQCPCKFLLCSFSYHQTATHAEILHTTQTYSYIQTFDNYLINQQLTLNFRCWEDIYFPVRPVSFSEELRMFWNTHCCTWDLSKELHSLDHKHIFVHSKISSIGMYT